MRFGIGLNSGECCVGNLGSLRTLRLFGDRRRSQRRFAFRGAVQALRRHCRGWRTGSQARAQQFPALELDLVQVKGRRRPVRIHTFLELLGTDEQQLKALQLAHTHFLAAYRNQQWGDAERLLARCRSIGVTALTGYYTLFASRIVSLRGQSRVPSWMARLAWRRLLAPGTLVRRVAPNGFAPRPRLKPSGDRRCDHVIRKALAGIVGAVADIAVVNPQIGSERQDVGKDQRRTGDHQDVPTLLVRKGDEVGLISPFQARQACPERKPIGQGMIELNSATTLNVSPWLNFRKQQRWRENKAVDIAQAQPRRKNQQIR